ncbi:hypothetical protein CLAIMM_11483 [Cladophialophora immunda]|nr:hypothetical protein CLAIMM_11483 [Cladophialophora immunda]
MSSLARKSMIFMRDVYNLAANPGDLLLSTTTSTSSQGYQPPQGLSSQFNPAYAHPYPLPPVPPTPVAPPQHHYSYPGPHNAQSYGHWSGPLAPISPPLPQTALNVYPVAHPAPNIQASTGRPPSPPSPIMSPSIPQPYGNQPAHGPQRYTAVQAPPARRPPHHQHASSWQSPTSHELHYQYLSDGAVSAQDLADLGPNPDATPHRTSSGRHSVSDGQWGTPRAESSRLPFGGNTDSQHLTSGYVGAASSVSCAPIPDQHSSATPVSAMIGSGQIDALGYHEMPAVAVHNVPVGRQESRADVLPGLPELPNNPAHAPLSTRASSYPVSAAPAELEAYSCTVEAVELPASPVTAPSTLSTDASSSLRQRPRRASRYQRHYSTAAADAASMSELLAATSAVELDSTPVVAGFSTMTGPATSTTNAQHSPGLINPVNYTHSGCVYQAYPGPAPAPSTFLSSDPPSPRQSSHVTNPSPRAGHTRTRSSAAIVVLGGQQSPSPDVYQMHRHQLVSSPVSMAEAEADKLVLTRARARTASLPSSTPGSRQPPPSQSEPKPRLQSQEAAKLPYPLHHSTGAVTMPLHQDYVRWNGGRSRRASTAGMRK